MSENTYPVAIGGEEEANPSYSPDYAQANPQRPVSGQSLLTNILSMSLVLAEDWVNLSTSRRAELQSYQDPDTLLDALVNDNLLTRYQASRLRVGKLAGLVLGNYRILDRIGAGAMGVVYKAEHIRMRHTVAIKVLSMGTHQDPQLLTRFYTEMRAVARLRHPNIVTAIDAGEFLGEADEPSLHYFVMEYVQGQNLEQHVTDNGPMSSARACQIIYLVASALEEAHKHHLVHRDIKPSNILVTAENQVKLLDFGLAMHFRNRMTDPGTLLGTIDYMAPEQARDASSVDVRADIYSLGATFFWCLTGQVPFPAQKGLLQDLVARVTEAAPSVCSIRPELSADLDKVVLRMMALEPADRFPTPQSVNRALLRFVERHSLVNRAQSYTQEIVPDFNHASGPNSTTPGSHHRVLVVDDEQGIRELCLRFLQDEGTECEVAASAEVALGAHGSNPYDLALIDVNMPGMSGLELVRRLRADAFSANLKIVMFSGQMMGDDMARLLAAGVDDYLAKPFSGVQLTARIKACLRHKDAEDRSDRLSSMLLTVNAELEKNVSSRDIDLIHTRNVLVLAMAAIVEQRHTETTSHLKRMQRYCSALAEAAAQIPAFLAMIDEEFIELLVSCVPLHDIGMVAIPDYILLKPDKLTDEERILMQNHTTIGADSIRNVTRQQGSLTAFVQMAADICRHHHERFNGTGYPDRLQGNAIPLSARLTALADVYDALRCRRAYRPSMSHNSALQIMKALSDGHFDSALMPAFERCGPQFEAIFRELED